MADCCASANCACKSSLSGKLEAFLIAASISAVVASFLFLVSFFTVVVVFFLLCVCFFVIF
ncbi:hypothetical protein BAZSYMA_ACONTIG72579_3 [Bathymodiolus azoricus thioautotrophic gill symbiont]|uniref:Uncharacterized protein n=1 Tax=Bathymodiolus azoricus thioautotrophic gill symbiont TaxID=235205 RepID=A0A1H6K0C6_9GAMM|nr:hypothetical protein BAZSYMA_ACONTIG72579_3 [Bathymodiolus azoricus thioautotrophic gill symbiont]